jgi:hypothetical protein
MTLASNQMTKAHDNQAGSAQQPFLRLSIPVRATATNNTTRVIAFNGATQPSRQQTNWWSWQGISWAKAAAPMMQVPPRPPMHDGDIFLLTAPGPRRSLKSPTISPMSFLHVGAVEPHGVHR